MRSSVDFPEPFCPITPTRASSSTSRLRPSRTVRAPNDLTAPRSEISLPIDPGSVVSPCVIDVPQTAVTPLVLRHAERLSERPALIDADGAGAIAYGELPGRIGRMATGLAALGLCKGDVLALVLPNVPEFVLAFHAAATLGAIVTPVDPTLTPNEARVQLRDSGARLVVTLAELVPAASAAADGTRVERVLALDDPVLQGAGETAQVAVDPARDLVALPYSSGTTGFAKGVMLTHRNLVANVVQVERVFGVGESDTIAAVLPFFHIYGLTVNMNLALARGVTVVTMRRFELDAFLRRGRAPSGYACVPRAADSARSGQASRGRPPRHVLAAGDRLGCRAARRRSGPRVCGADRVRRLPGLRPDRGQPGHAPAARRPRRRGPPGDGRPGASGHRMQGGRSGDAAPLPAGTDGEIAVRGPQVMRGYLGDPEATAAAVDADGWLHTGDLGHIDSDGRLHLVDRLKELIKVRGFQVAPAELEAVLVSHPAVADAAVIPVTDAARERGAQGVRRPESEGGDGRATAVRCRSGGAPQAAAAGRGDRRGPPDAVGQDPAAGADRARAGAWTRHALRPSRTGCSRSPSPCSCSICTCPRSGPARSDALGHQWPADVSYIVSFVTIGVIWVNHHDLMRHIRHTDRGLLFLNVFLLMTVAVLPYPTALVSHYARTPNATTAALAYGVTMVTMALLFNALWHYSIRGGLLVAGAAARDLGDHPQLPARAVPVSDGHAHGPCRCRCQPGDLRRYRGVLRCLELALGQAGCRLTERSELPCGARPRCRR